MKKILASLCALAFGMSVAVAEVIQTEYFFDEDPGFGKGYKAGVTTTGVVKFKANLRGLKSGFHTLYVRGKNYDGWSHCVAIPVTVYERSSEIVGSEYYFDKDPGEGKGHFVQTSEDENVAAAINEVDLKGLSYGFHTLYSRALSNTQEWTSALSIPFIYLDLVAPSPKRAEYYVDKDPGEGNGKVVTLMNGTVAFPMNTDNLKSGNHTLYIRTQDESGLWSVDYGIPFEYDYVKETVKWNEDFSINPNPTMFNFDLNVKAADTDSTKISVVLQSQSGKVMLEESHAVYEKKININVKDFAPGSYEVVVDKNGVVSILKLLIKR